MAIRRAVDEWRDKQWPGITDTTRTLLNFWFRSDHRLANGRPFAYHQSQREAMETLVYLYEVQGVHRHKDLIERYAGAANFRLLRFDDFARYGVKMATGGGKTKVMALAIAWQYFNAVAGGRADYARTFLVIAPNVIVFERLRSDFGGGRIFRADPVIPPELRLFWDLQFYLRGDPERASSEGALYLTNIQQLYERPQDEDDEPDPISAVLGYAPPTGNAAGDDFMARIVARGGPAVVLNDEAHHTHDEESIWNQTIRRLHADLSGKAGGNGHHGAPPGIGIQLDFSATPRHSKGALFSWTVFDYPLKQAMIDGIVKRPI